LLDLFLGAPLFSIFYFASFVTVTPFFSPPDLLFPFFGPLLLSTPSTHFLKLNCPSYFFYPEGQRQVCTPPLLIFSSHGFFLQGHCLFRFPLSTLFLFLRPLRVPHSPQLIFFTLAAVCFPLPPPVPRPEVLTNTQLFMNTLTLPFKPRQFIYIYGLP